MGEARIKVIGVGGGGCNAVNRMCIDGIEGVEVYAVNTDLQHLNILEVPNKVQIGEKVTRGLGAGAKPEMGEQAALEDIDKIRDILHDADMVFIATGLGGGTGTGAAPVIAKTAKDMGILTVAVATLPFRFEGKKKMERALEGLEKLKSSADTYIIIHNDRLNELPNKSISFKDAFKEVDGILSKAVRGITDIVVTPAMVNVDFADVRTTMENGGLALIGFGEGKGENKIEEAVKSATSSPLLEGNDIAGAQRLLLTLWVSPNISFDNVYDAVDNIKDVAHENVELIFGAIVDEETEDLVKISVIATSFDKGSSIHSSRSQEGGFKVITGSKSASQTKKAVPDDSIYPVEPENLEDIPAYVRKKRKF
jgi:cell division protein FtsZ